jgi:DNA transformation protein and related proteins
MTTLRNSQSELADLPNIGREVVKLLVSVGIRTPQDLIRLGAVAAAARIRAIRPADPPCRSMLAGLEGAIRGTRWHAIPKEQREALWKEYQSRTGACTTARKPRQG